MHVESCEGGKKQHIDDDDDNDDGKGKVNMDLYSASSWSHLLARLAGMARILKGSHSFTCLPHVHPLTEWTAFPAEAGTYLPTPEGWKSELALGGWLVTYQNKGPAPGIEPGHGRPSQY